MIAAYYTHAGGDLFAIVAFLVLLYAVIRDMKNPGTGPRRTVHNPNRWR